MIFVFPIFTTNRSLTNFSDSYAISPNNKHQPADYVYSRSIDGSPIFFFHSSDLLNSKLIKEGKTFFWNSYVGFGAPWLGSMQAAQYYPFKYVSYLWPDYWKGADFMRVLLFLVAGIGMYLLLISLGVSRRGALLGGLSYMLCQRLFLVINMPSFHVEALLPFMLFFIHEMIKTRKWHFVILAGCVAGIQFLGGQPESSFIFGFVAVLFFLWALFHHYKSKKLLMIGLLSGLIIVIISLAISGFHIMEFVRYLGLSNHVHVDTYGTITKSSFWLLNLFLPNFFGQPFEPSWLNEIPDTRYISDTDHFRFSLFCGISTLWLALFAIIRKHKNCPYFFLGLLIFFVGYDFGFPILKYVGSLPLFNYSSNTWNAFVIPFCIAVIAGFGLDSMFGSSSNKNKQSLILTTVLYISIVFVLCLSLNTAYPGSVSTSLFVPLVLVFLALFLAYFLIHYKKKRGIGYALIILVLVLESFFADSSLGYLHYYNKEKQPLPSEIWLKENVDHERIFGLKGVFPANTLNPQEIRDVRHLDAMYPKLYIDYVDSIWPGAKNNVYTPGQNSWENYNDILLDLAAVKYIVSLAELPEAQESEGKFKEVYKDDDLYIYSNEEAFPRVRFVANSWETPDEFTPIALKEADRDFSDGVFLENHEEVSATNTSDIPLNYEIQCLEDNPDKLRLHVSVPSDGFIVIADLFYPGWKAYVDENETSIYKANYAFKAIEVKKGEHDILISYQPWNLLFGFPLMIATLAGISLYIFIIFGRKVSYSLRRKEKVKKAKKD